MNSNLTDGEPLVPMRSILFSCMTVSNSAFGIVLITKTFQARGDSNDSTVAGRLILGYFFRYKKIWTR